MAELDRDLIAGLRQNTRLCKLVSTIVVMCRKTLVLALRLGLRFNPFSYTLAFTMLPPRTYVAAYALALAPVVAIAMLATGWFTRR